MESTADHKARHVWARTPAGIRLLPKPDAAAIGRLELDEAVRQAMRIEIRYSH